MVESSETASSSIKLLSSELNPDDSSEDAPRNFASRCDDSPVLNLSGTRRNRLRFVARSDDETFLAMIEAIENADSDDQSTSERIIRAEMLSREQSARNNALLRERLCALQPQISQLCSLYEMTIEELNLVFERIIKNKKLLRQFARTQDPALVKLLGLYIKFIKDKVHDRPEIDLTSPLANGIYGDGSYGEPGSVRATNLAIFRNGRALPGLQAAAALDLVETRKSIELAEERGRRGGRPRKGTTARTEHERQRVTPETKLVLKELAAAGITSGDILDMIALGYRKAFGEGTKPPKRPRALLISVGNALNQAPHPAA